MAVVFFAGVVAQAPTSPRSVYSLTRGPTQKVGCVPCTSPQHRARLQYMPTFFENSFVINIDTTWRKGIQARHAPLSVGNDHNNSTSHTQQRRTKTLLEGITFYSHETTQTCHRSFHKSSDSAGVVSAVTPEIHAPEYSGTPAAETCCHTRSNSI